MNSNEILDTDDHYIGEIPGDIFLFFWRFDEIKMDPVDGAMTHVEEMIYQKLESYVLF